MAINVNLAQSQANQISSYVDVLKTVRNDLHSFHSNINNAWSAEEMIYVNRAIENINREISNLSSALDELGRSIASTAREIRKEEEEAEAAARAAASRMLLR